MVYYDFQSALPMITEEQFGDMDRINELNLLAENYQSCLIMIYKAESCNGESGVQRNFRR